MVLEYLAANALEKFINRGYEGMTNDELLDSMGMIGLIISIMISLATAYLAYECNRGSNAGVRWLVTLVAFLFSGLYLIYYLFAHVVFGDQCKTRKLNFFSKGMRGMKKRKLVKRKKTKKKKTKRR